MPARPRRLWPLVMQKTALVPPRWRRLLLRRAGCAIDPRSHLEHGIDFVPGAFAIGAGSFVNREGFLDCSGGIAIGRNTLLGPRVVVLTTTHDVQDTLPRAGPPRYDGVRIGDGAWIGAGATILPGVTIGDGAVVAAGAVVRGDLEPHGLYAGVPAMLKRRLPTPGGTVA